MYFVDVKKFTTIINKGSHYWDSIFRKKVQLLQEFPIGARDETIYIKDTRKFLRINTKYIF